MKILAIDTATEACSVALLNEGESFSLFEVCPQQQSQQILPMVDKLLSEHGLKVGDLDAIAYGRGPGSFTGVRIATSTIQGLALGANLPVIEVSTLAAMAQQNFAQYGNTTTVVLIDARMQEVYFGLYSVTNGVVEPRMAEAVMPPDKVFETLSTLEPFAIAGTGFEAYGSVFEQYMHEKSVKVHYPNAHYMLELALKAYNNGESVQVENIKPVYLRDTVTWKKLPHKA